ncbi:MAG TPA: alpha/beta hydrolase [Rhizobiaceae bacterium]|nr:alpha/beta hydrolase [Rhizobiaceae bacterium]
MTPLQQTRISTPSGDLAVFIRSGSGMPVLMWPSIFYDHTLYAGLVALLDNPVAIVEGPGHGASAASRDGLDIPTLAGAAAQVAADVFGRQPYAMVGTSWGALVAAELASKGGDGPAAVALFNAPWKEPARPSLSDRMIAAMAQSIPRTGIFRNGVARSFFAPQTHARNPALVRDFLAQATFSNPGLAAAVRSVLVDRHSRPATALERIAVPTLVASGEHDTLYDPELARRVASRMANARYAMVRGVAHIAIAEDPGQSADLIRNLLQRVQASNGARP